MMRTIGLLLVVVFLTAGCGGMPSIPKQSNAILAKANDNFENGRYFQSAELYKAFLAQFPGDDQSDFAQFRLAESYRLDKQYPLAAIEYQLVLSNYGYSEYVDDALFYTGVTFFEEMPAANKDLQKARDALSRFEQFQQTFPQSPLMPQALEYVQEIKKRLAEKDYRNASFYFGRKRFRAAIIYLDKVLENYPGNEYWARAAYMKGLIRLQQGEHDDAAKLFSDVVAYPQDVDVKSLAQEKLGELSSQ